MGRPESKRKLFQALKAGAGDIELDGGAFKTYVRPLVEHATEIYYPFTKKDIARIENVHKYFTPTAFKRCKLTCVSHADRLSIMPLESFEIRRVKFDVCVVYVVQNFVSIQSATFLGILCSLQPRSESQISTSINQRSFKNRVSNFRNSLTAEIIEASGFIF